MKLSLEISTDSVVIGTLASSAILGISYVAASQRDINVTCIATAGIAFVTFITFSLFNVTTVPGPTKSSQSNRPRQE
jgi:hypothetical protein